MRGRRHPGGTEKEARLGMSSVEAAAFLKQEVPEVENWLCWCPVLPLYCVALGRIPVGTQARGRIGAWSWRREPCSYPTVTYWRAERVVDRAVPDWTGLIRIRHRSGKRFLLFSFQTPNGVVGLGYMVSTHDYRLLARFAKAVYERYRPKPAVDDKWIRINVVQGRDFRIPMHERTEPLLPPEMRQDIEEQAFSFFRSRHVYRRHDLRFQRGFLFVGPPGTGKTMMIRHLVRQCRHRFKLRTVALSMTRRTNDEKLEELFVRATRVAPTMLILEDIDTLTRETAVTRAGLLAKLDGLQPRNGVLVLASTNSPEDIDPALIHRPSRFDRVWHFDLPDTELRREYLRARIPGIDGRLLRELVAGTESWSFAYLNELRTTAVLLALREKREIPAEQDLREAHRLLAGQFKGGSTHYAGRAGRERLGFAIA